MSIALVEDRTPICHCTNTQDWLRRLAAGVYQSPDGCWLWSRALNPKGYGQFVYWTKYGQRRATGAHRAAWLAYRGDITDPSLELDHLCRVRSCANPWHLELVSAQENNRRGLGNGRHVVGCGEHGFDDGYEAVRPSGQKRWTCRPCARRRWTNWKAKQM